MSDLRITDIRALRLVGPDAHGIGGVPRTVSSVIVRVDTDAGISGLGEAPDFLGDREGIAYARAWLVGRDPLEIAPFVRAMLYGALPVDGALPAPSIMSPTATATGGIAWAASAVEMALHDIAGKRLGVPVHVLLGGAYRNTIRVYVDRSGVARPDDRDAWRKLAADTVAEGYDFLKVDLEQVAPEARRDSWNRSIATAQARAIEQRLTAVREGAGDDVDVALDGHMCFDVESAVRIANRLAPLHLRWLEDPIPILDHDGLAEVRGRSPIPICAGEMFVVEQFASALRRDAIDIAHPDVLFVGGIREARRAADLADVHGVPVAFHNNGGAIATMAAAQAAAATPNFIGLEWHYAGAPWLLDAVRRVGGGPLIDAGAIPLDGAPGLGVELDREACRRYLGPGESLFD